MFAERIRALPAIDPPTMAAALVVDAGAFAISAQSATDNRYVDVDAIVEASRAMAQHRDLQAALLAAGVPVVVLPACAGLDDAVFPNNVYATAPGGRAVIGSMRHPVRRAEAARADARALLRDTLRYEVVDLSDGPVGELTGVLAIDRPRRAAICGLTGRCAFEAVAPMAQALGLEMVLATPLDAAEYHLNVVLAVLAGRAVVMYDGAFSDPAVPAAIDAAWPGAVHHLTRAEKDAFVANCLAITPDRVALSATAAVAMTPQTAAFLAAHGFAPVAVDVSALEAAGGSLRCLVCELF